MTGGNLVNIAAAYIIPWNAPSKSAIAVAGLSGDNPGNLPRPAYTMNNVPNIS